MTQRTKYHAFGDALGQHPDIRRTLPSRTWRRYRDGLIPAAVQLLIDHPELLRSFLAAVDQYSISEYAKMPATVFVAGEIPSNNGHAVSEQSEAPGLPAQ